MDLDAPSARGPKWYIAFGLVVLFGGAALGPLWHTETTWLGRWVFALLWTVLYSLAALLTKRRVLPAAIATAIVFGAVLLSQLKFSMLRMPAYFIDLFLIDTGSTLFLARTSSLLRSFGEGYAAIALFVISASLTVALWWTDPFRPRRWVSAAVGAGATVALVATFATMRLNASPFEDKNHVSLFLYSAYDTLNQIHDGIFDFDKNASPPRLPPPESNCTVARKPPNIILVLDESAFDASATPATKIPSGYREHFKSFDGRTRKLFVDGAGGPTWFTEVNVLTGTTALSFRTLQGVATRLAAGRIHRGLPIALRRCGYETISLYPADPNFLGSFDFQSTVGIRRYIEPSQMKPFTGNSWERDEYYYNQAVRLLKERATEQPYFIFVYTVFNHWPYTTVLRPDLTPAWLPPGNAPDVDEYLRRQTLSAEDYRTFIQRLSKDFPGEPFLIIRFGDHQPPDLGARLVDPTASAEEVARRISWRDPRYFTTYYVIDGVNFKPADTSSALDGLDAAYLPIVVQRAAGIPLDPSFAEQELMLHRCQGTFYACGHRRSELRRFNRMLVDAGLVTHVDSSLFRLPAAEVDNDGYIEGKPPQLIETIGRWNVVKYNGRYYGVPHALGPINLQTTDVSKMAGVFVTSTAAEMRKVLRDR